MAHCYPDDHRVAFVLSNSQVLLWEWNGILTELKPNHISDPQQQSKLSIPGVIWHPQLRHTFYVCQLRMTHIDTQGGEVIVIKYVNGKADKEFYFQVEHPGKTFLTHVPGLQSFKCGLSIQRTNPWGAWQIAIAHAYGQAHTGPNTVRAYTRSYMFDVYSESFRQLEFDTAFGDRTALFASPGYLVADDRGNLSQSSGLPWGVHWQDRLVTISDVAITNQPSTEREQQILANNDLTRRPSQYAEVLGDGRVLLVLGDNGFVVWAWEDMPEMPLFDDCHD
ncbi:nonribosomal peptide synthetase 7 [Purpureocillium lavendulum]|uniref:Nonribosomal peptide synthetase 7 n=1 Tax=Purpureocillium lavendulum TaxID=1247861 RepID=A0AB34FLM7_9HYPO|nr:nonribosomal peptide synthetase 7 [Purpureocillium lavendulum]